MNFNLREIGSKLSTRGWITVGVAAIVGVLFIYLLLNMASSPSYTTIVAGQSPAQTGKATAALSGAGIPYQLSNNGTAVSVETSKESQARVVLDQQGLLLGSGASESLESYLGKTSLGESNFQQEQQNTSALEQQLDQTIEGMNGINQAQVLLSIPDDTTDLFSGTNTQASASVLLNTNGSLGTAAVKAIAESVGDAVPGLSSSKVTVTDQNGDLLWPTTSGGTSSGTSLTAKQSAENAYDTQIADEADAMLATTLGPGKALVHVNADLNANQQQISSVSYGKTGTPLSAKLGNENLTGTGASTGGATGTTGTQIAAYAGTNGNGNSKYSNKTSNTSYGVNKTVSQSTIAPGKVNQQSISVLVNSSVPATELPTIRAAVQTAVGFNRKRGDTLSIGALPFAKIPATAASSSSSKLGDVKYVLVGVGALVFLLFMSRLLRKRETDDFAGKPTWLRELEIPRSLSELEAQTRMVDLEGPTMVARLRPPVNVAKQQVEELVDRDPERVAAQIRQWMTED
ncbi:MAG TPA: flagellar basal-body MS-ring/collar protein FliF [Solirubrobacteraceae bacterium]|jgi:flagellar M-ring protein FliF|nr:flagellar basal-body MS-ring/collar protein FliF [Solirubrobacteraceae bacterium]